MAAVDVAIADMTGAVDATPIAVGGGNAQGASVTMGKLLDGRASPSWWNPYMAQYNDPTWDTLENWWFINRSKETNQTNNVRIQMRNVRLQIQLTSTKQWITLTNTNNPSGDYYPPSATGLPSGPASKRNAVSGGGVEFKFDGNLGYTNIHGYGGGRVDVSQYQGNIYNIICTVEARLVLDDPNGIDDRALAGYMLNCGCDTYPDMDTRVTSSANPSDNFDPTGYNPGMFSGRFKYITNDWQLFSGWPCRTAYLVDPSRNTTVASNTLKTVTEADFRAFPPVFSLEGGTTPAPGPVPPPPPPPPPTSSYVRYNYILNSETWNEINNNIAISSAASPPPLVSSWSTLTGGASYTGGAQKFCSIPNGNIAASVYLGPGSVNFAMVKIQPNTYNKAIFIWCDLASGTITYTRAVNWPTAFTATLQTIETGKHRLKIITSLSDSVPVGIEVAPVSGSEVYSSASGQSIKAGGVKFEPDTKVTNYFPSGATIGQRTLASISLFINDVSFGINHEQPCYVTAEDDQGFHWDQEEVTFVSDNPAIAGFLDTTAETDADGSALAYLRGNSMGTTNIRGRVGDDYVTTDTSITIDSTGVASSVTVEQSMENFAQIVSVENVNEDPEPLPPIEIQVAQNIVDIIQTFTMDIITIEGPVSAPTLIVGKSGVSPIALVGTGVVGASITLMINGSPEAESITVDPDGVWSTTLDLEEGDYTIYAYQEYEGELSSISNIETITILAVGEGGNRFRSGSGTGPRKAIRPVKPTKSFSWPTK